MEFRNPVFLEGNARINCEVNHPELGWIPYTSSEAGNAELWAAIIASGPAPYIAPPPPTLEEVKAARLSELQAVRRDRENGGTSFNGTALATDEKTRGVLTVGYVRSREDPDHTIEDYKFGPAVFGTLDASTIIAASLAVEAHVQACFSRESNLSAQIMAASDEAAVNAIDIETGWP